MTTPRKRPRHPQPMQPLVWDGRVLRFQSNAIVEYIVRLLSADGRVIATEDGERIGYSALIAMSWSDADRDQFNQLVGYSVSGLPYRSKKTQRAADALAELAIAKRYPKRGRK